MRSAAATASALAPQKHARVRRRCTECLQFPARGTKLRDGRCKGCRDKSAKPRICSDCQLVPAPGERLYDGRCPGCRAKSKAGAILGDAATAGAAGTSVQASDQARQIVAPVIASFELAQLRSRVAGVEKVNAQLRLRLRRVHSHVAGMVRRYEALAALLGRDLDEQPEGQP